MWKDVIGFLAIMVVALCGIGVLMACLLVPMAWMEGRAKQRWLRETQGVEIPWYEAAFLDVQINDADVTLETTADNNRT